MSVLLTLRIQVGFGRGGQVNEGGSDDCEESPEAEDENKGSAIHGSKSAMRRKLVRRFI